MYQHVLHNRKSNAKFSDDADSALLISLLSEILIHNTHTFTQSAFYICILYFPFNPEML